LFIGIDLLVAGWSWTMLVLAGRTWSAPISA
jgi:hypothetical protein